MSENDLPRYTHAPDRVFGGRVIYRRDGLYDQTAMFAVRLTHDRRHTIQAVVVDREEAEAANALCDYLERRDRGQGR